MSKAKRKAPLLRCRKCGAWGDGCLTVERGQNSRTVRGKKRTAVNVTCRSCGHEWWSVNRDAVRAARAKDARAGGA